MIMKSLGQTFDPSSIDQIISKAVNSLQTKPNSSSSGVGRSPCYVGKPYNDNPRPSQLPFGAGGNLDSGSTCFYYKDMGHRKENCIHLNCKLAHKLQMTKGIVAQLEDTTTDAQPH